MATIEVLTPWLESVVRDVLAVDHLHRDHDGDIPVPLDRAVMFIRMGEGPRGVPRVRVFGPMLKGIEATAALFEKLNEVNREATYLRFYLDEDVLWSSIEIVAESFRAEDLTNSLDAAVFYSEHIGTLLGIPDAAPWRDAATDDGDGDRAAETSTDEPVTPGSGRTTRPTAVEPHSDAPGKVVPGPVGGDGPINLRLGYLV